MIRGILIVAAALVLVDVLAVLAFGVAWWWIAAKAEATPSEERPHKDDTSTNM